MYYFGIDLGGTNISAALVDENFNIISKKRYKTMIPTTKEVLCDKMANLTFEILNEYEGIIDKIPFIGIGCPGNVNPKNGEVRFLPNLFIENWKIKSMMEERLKKRVYIENDANLAAYGEYIAGAAIGTRSAITITIGTGIGGGIILDGKIYSGFNHWGAEIGHMVIMHNGHKCNCGRRGCYEAYASATALAVATKEALKNDDRSSIMWEIIEGDINNVSPKTAFIGMKMNDSLATQVVNKYIEYLSVGIINIINIFQPEIICIGGGISNEGEYLINLIEDYIKNNSCMQVPENQTKICIAKLGNNAGIIGAACFGEM